MVGKNVTCKLAVMFETPISRVVEISVNFKRWGVSMICAIIFFYATKKKKIIKICCWKLLHFLILPFPTLSYWVRFTWYLELCILFQDFLKQLLIFKYLHLLGDGGGFHYMLTKQYCRYLILCKYQTFVIISFNSKL